MQMERVVAAATAWADSATVAPWLRSGSTLAGSMSWTTREKPRLARFVAIGPPMFPSPMNPTAPAIARSFRNDRMRRA